MPAIDVQRPEDLNAICPLSPEPAASEQRRVHCSTSGTPNDGRGPQIRSIEDVPRVGESAPRALAFVDPFCLAAEGALTIVSGESGAGKSSVVLGAIVKPALESGRNVLILDRENPHFVIDDRLRLFGIPDDQRLRYWGGWLPEEAPQPGGEMVVSWVRRQERPPLVVVDTLVAFLQANENDSEAVRKWMNQCRVLADLGAAVLVVTHTGKSENAQDFRGSSDIKGSCDSGIKVTNSSTDGRLGSLRLVSWKSRFGRPVDARFQYVDGRFIPEDSGLQPAEPASEQQLTALLRTNPGIFKSKFETKATGAGISRVSARDFVDSGIQSGRIQSQTGKTGGTRLSLVPEDQAA